MLHTSLESQSQADNKATIEGNITKKAAMAAIKIALLFLVAVALASAADSPKASEKLETSDTVGLGYYRGGHYGGYAGYGGYAAYPGYAGHGGLAGYGGYAGYGAYPYASGAYGGYAGYPYNGYRPGYGAAGYYPHNAYYGAHGYY